MISNEERNQLMATGRLIVKDGETFFDLALVAEQLSACEDTVLALCREDATELFGGQLHPKTVDGRTMFEAKDVLKCVDDLMERRKAVRAKRSLSTDERLWARAHASRDYAYLLKLEEAIAELRNQQAQDREVGAGA